MPRSEAGKEVRRAGARARYWKNRERLLAGAKVWRAQNGERVRALDKKRSRLYPRRDTARKAGITKEAANEFVASRPSHCEICGKTPGMLNLDHDHASGSLRGVLCRSCNRGLGDFYDRPDLLRYAAAYLERRAN